MKTGRLGYTVYMEYLDPFRDRDWEEQLKVANILSTSDFANLQGPSSGHLMELLYMNAGRVPEAPFLNWLVREHGFVRIPPALVSADLIARWTESPAQRNYLLEHFIYPIAEDKYTVSIAMAHPIDERQKDYMDRIFGKFMYRQFIAVTPGEAAKIHKRYKEVAQ